MMGRLAAWLAAAAVIVGLDRVTKLLASERLVYGVPEPVVTGFNLTLLYNTGAAFSLLANASGWQRWLFAGLAVVVCTLLIGMLHRADARDWWLRTGLVLVLGGALGNLWDRLSLGYVVDFIQLYYRDWYWPAFNLADAAICVGAVMILLHGTPVTRARG